MRRRRFYPRAGRPFSDNPAGDRDPLTQPGLDLTPSTFDCGHSQAERSARARSVPPVNAHCRSVCSAGLKVKCGAVHTNICDASQPGKASASPRVSPISTAVARPRVERRQRSIVAAYWFPAVHNIGCRYFVVPEFS